MWPFWKEERNQLLISLKGSQNLILLKEKFASIEIYLSRLEEEILNRC